MDEPEKYPVGTIFEMAAIPIEARARFLDELPDMLAKIDGILDANKMLAGIATINIQTPIWVDDNKGTRTISMTSENPEMSMTFTDKIKRSPA